MLNPPLYCTYPDHLDPLYARSRAAAAGDPFAADVLFLCNFDGTNGGQDATDEGPLSKSLIWRTAGTQLSNAQTFDGDYATSLLVNANNEGVRVSSFAEMEFGSGPYTIEARVRANGVTGNQALFALQNSGGGDVLHLRQSTTTFEYADARSSFNQRIASASIVSATTWYEAACTFDGDVITIYKDGVVVGTNDPAQNTLNGSSTMDFDIGISDLVYEFVGHIQAVRVTNADRHGGVGYTPDPGRWAI
jgi:hypothetical protein